MNRYNREQRAVGEVDFCLECGSPYDVKREWHYFCSSKCRVKYWLKENYDSKRVKELEDRIRVLEKSM